MNFITTQYNIKSLVAEKFEFLIPVYQRPYVWDDTEVKKLLEDLKYNFYENNMGSYFVGNTYVIKSNKAEKGIQFEVIDGQQRFTTFWLISLCFNTLKIGTELIEYLEINYNNTKDIRFDFDIRKEVYEYLKGLLDGTSERRFHDVSNFEFLKNIAKGIDTINSFLNSELIKDELKHFGDYIYNHVKFVVNEAPENTDLNALFVALGTTGIQLQQSDILKARLLDKISDKDQRIIYSKIWESCENMNNYFESNVKNSFSYDPSVVSEIDFSEFNQLKFGVNGEFKENRTEGFTINDIIIDNGTVADDYNPVKEINTQCRSIVSFNVFLLHVLRIYRKNNNEDEDIDSLDPKKLLETFKLDEIANVTEFIKLMWKVRYLFDKHIVKWLKDEDESFDEGEKLLLSKINILTREGKTYFSRIENAYTNVQMLQSVLYFTGIFTQQYWLSPFLNFLLENDKCLNEGDKIEEELERIDNIMVPGDKKEMSWKIMINKAISPKGESIIQSLKGCLGVRFNHYWFYKLEYLLWKSLDKNEDKYKRYRITSKNSIEHVFPQNQEYKIKLIDLEDKIDWLNSFGNLALLSVGQNSSYSNQDVEKKRIDFNNKATYDSLKLAKIYLNKENWKSLDIRQHQKEMLDLFEKHYNKYNNV